MTDKTEDPKFTDEAPAADGETKSRKDRLTGSTHFGDTDFNEETADQIGDATWSEVCTACCNHSAEGWATVFGGTCILIFLLYFFLLGLNLMGSAAKVIGGCTAGALLGDDINPVGGLMIGILATVFLQSSSTTTSIVIGLVGNGITPKLAIYMIMGANIGTSVTNTIVAMGQMGDGDQLERAFAGACVHDMFNILTVLILLPLEAATGYLFYLTKAMLPAAAGEKGEKWVGPLKKIVSPLSDKIIKSNKNLIKDIAKGGSCDDYYPVVCYNNTVSKATCDVGLIACGDVCPAFFQEGATEEDDKVSGGVCLFLSLVLLVVCLVGLVTLLQKMLLGTSTRIVYKATNIHPVFSILIGAGITILVQSSSITTSALTPLVGLGVLKLEQMYPLTLGANVGTTVTGLLAAMVASSLDSLQVALCHLFFNLTGIVIWYVNPFWRPIPLKMAKALGKLTRWWRFFPVLYILVAFFAIPALLLGLSSLFDQKQPGYTALGSFIVVTVLLAAAYFVYWYKKMDGEQKAKDFMADREKRRVIQKDLPDTIDTILADLTRLKEHTGLPDSEEVVPVKAVALDA